MKTPPKQAEWPPIEPTEQIHDVPQRKGGSFKGDVLRLVSGTSIAQIISILAAPIITRLYGPEAFGIAAMFSSLAGILGVLACMQYEQSIVLPDNDREAANLLGVSLSFSCMIAFLTVPITWFGGPQLLQLIKMPELIPYLWLVPVSVLTQGIFIALNYWNTRTKHFTRLAVAQVTSQLAVTSTNLGAGLTGHATGGAMIAAAVGAQTVGVAVLGTQIWRSNGKFLMQSICWRDMLAGLDRHRKFPIYTTWSSLLNTASWQLPVLMLGAFFTPAVAGFYALGFRILQMPMSLIGRAVGQVFLQRAAVEHANENLAPLVEELFRRLLILALLPCLVLTIIGRDLFGFVFGLNWTEAGVFTQLLAPWALVWFVSSPLSTLYYVLEKQKEEMGIQAIIFLTRLVSIWVGGILNEPRLAVALFAVSGIFAYGYLIKILFDFVQLSIKALLVRSIKALLTALIYVSPIVIVKVSGLDALILLFVSGSVLLLFFLRERRAL